MAKVLGHGTNYRGQPFTMRQHTKLDMDLITDFQRRYFTGFPEIARWHGAVETALKEDGYLINLLGRKRWFFGRRTEQETVRKAVAYDPQSSVADILNRDMLAVWRLNIVQLLLQVHDAILIQYPEEKEDELIPKILAAMSTEVALEAGRSLRIPNEVKTGWNWGNATPDNPDGLKKWKGGDVRRRERHPAASILDRKFY
jgi:DNA polymerase I-like protein with 3'-5' exonuclease and polymerase domains